MRLDLHIHSTASDGACMPAEVVRRASEGGLDVIALTDHDTLAGVPEAMRAGEEHGVTVIPALEMSTHHDRWEIHILGYFVDLDDPALREHQATAVDARVDRMDEMVGRLRAQGVDITLDRVLEMAGPDRSSVGRPHLARALVEAGIVTSIYGAFDHWIGDGMPAHVPTRMVDAREVVTIIREAGGIAVWAHPPIDLVPRVLSRLVRSGLRGLEVYRPRNRPDQVLTLEQQARRKELFCTGGSDWHTPDSGRALGDFAVDRDQVEAFLVAGGM